jgi:hypothetical protein
MKAAIYLFWRICQMRTGPDQIPGNAIFALGTVLACALANGAILFWLRGADFAFGLLHVFLVTVVWLGTVYVVLALRKLTERFQQTMTAMLGTNIVIAFLSLPLIILGSLFTRVSLEEQESMEPSLWPIAASLGIVLLMTWDVCIKGFIFHKAFGINYLWANLFAWFLFVAVLALDFFWFGSSV